MVEPLWTAKDVANALNISPDKAHTLMHTQMRYIDITSSPNAYKRRIVVTPSEVERWQKECLQRIEPIRTMPKKRGRKPVSYIAQGFDENGNIRGR